MSSRLSADGGDVGRGESLSTARVIGEAALYPVFMFFVIPLLFRDEPLSVGNFVGAALLFPVMLFLIWRRRGKAAEAVESPTEGPPPPH